MANPFVPSKYSRPLFLMGSPPLLHLLLSLYVYSSIVSALTAPCLHWLPGTHCCQRCKSKCISQACLWYCCRCGQSRHRKCGRAKCTSRSRSHRTSCWCRCRRCFAIEAPGLVVGVVTVLAYEHCINESHIPASCALPHSMAYI